MYIYAIKQHTHTTHITMTSAQQHHIAMNYTFTIEAACGYSQTAFSNVLALASLPQFTLDTIVTNRHVYGNGGMWFKLTHKDGRTWLLSVGVNEIGSWTCLHDYKSKTGEFKPATDANSVAFDKMVEKLIGKNRHGETIANA